MTPHKQRHAYATHAYELGLKKETIAKFMGHDKTTTTDIYINQNPSTENVINPLDFINKDSKNHITQVKEPYYKKMIVENNHYIKQILNIQ